ncbi:hypothetical protein JCM15519_33750 [Fundidesulfovibrio butyratiphilus]
MTRIRTAQYALETEKFRWGVALLVFVVFCCFHVRTASAATKRALLIGINSYSASGNNKDLEGALNDVALMRDILTSPSFGFKAEDVAVLENEQATHSRVVAAIKALTTTASPGDLVYIHYSGHGSRACDLNGDESSRSGLDSTLVTSGSRADSKPPSSKVQCNPAQLSEISLPATYNLDTYDLLDDELDGLLDSLAAKCGQLVFVSDSCHSGTVTRGAGALQTRGTALDARPHPLGLLPYHKPQHDWLAIGAARDEEPAMEFEDAATAKKQGAFTWFWAKSLRDAGPSETWFNVFKRAAAMLSNAGYGQQPQFEGDKTLGVRGQRAEAGPGRYAVLYVSSDKTVATIEAGSILGVTKGSVFRKVDAAPGQEGTVTIDLLDTTRAKGSISGSIQAGDQLILSSYMPADRPLRVHLHADSPEDARQLDTLRARLKEMPAIQVTGAQSDSDVVLWVFRPGEGDVKSYLEAPEGRGLPASAPGNPVQCWMLTPAERFLNGQKQLRYLLDDRGLKRLQEDLGRLLKVRGLLDLPSAPGQGGGYAVDVKLYLPADSAQEPQEGCGQYKRILNKLYKFVGKASLSNLSELERPNAPTMVFFEIRNQSNEDYWFYIINFTRDGHVLAVPLSGSTINPTDPVYLVKAGESKAFCESGLKMTEDVEYLRVLASKTPVDVRIVEQDAFHGGIRGAGNTLETLLAGSVGNKTRGEAVSAQPAEEWSSLLAAFKVVQ